MIAIDMKMPGGCADCKFWMYERFGDDTKGWYWCVLLNAKHRDGYLGGNLPTDERNDRCPLMEVGNDNESVHS